MKNDYKSAVKTAISNRMSSSKLRILANLNILCSSTPHAQHERLYKEGKCSANSQRKQKNAQPTHSKKE